MKKILLLAATTSTILLSSIASSMAAAPESEFYVKAEAGATLFNKAKDGPSGLKMKAKPAPVFGLGVGYYLMDNCRADLSILFVTNAEMKKNASVAASRFIENAPGNAVGSVKHKPTIMALMLTGYVDAYDFSVANFFLGAGVGVTQIKEKETASYTYNGTKKELFGSTKKKTTFAYQLIAGVSAEFAPGVKGELSYMWRDFGKTKGKTINAGNLGNVRIGNTAYRGHNLIAGLRFDI